MPKVFFKNIFQEIKHSLGRFFSILCIVAIGVAFFAGIKASAPDMKNSADTHFDTYNVQDIQIYSTLGLYDEDIKNIEKIKGVENVQATFSMDTLAHKGTSEYVIKVLTYEENQKMNTIRLIDGRMPEKENECLVQAESTTGKMMGSFQLGDTITLESGTDEDLDQSLKNDTYKIVGTCYNPNYLSYELGSSSIGSGSVNSFIYVPNENILKDYYTEIDVTVKGAKDVDMYSDEYFDIVSPVLKKIEELEDESIQTQITKQQDKLDEAKQEYLDGIAEGQKKLDDAQDQIDEAKLTITTSEAKLASAKTQLESGWAQYNQNKDKLDYLPTLESAIQQIEEGEKQLPSLQNQLTGIQQQLAQQGITDLDGTINQLQSVKSTFETLTTINDQITLLQQQIETINTQIEQAQTEDEKNNLEAQKANLETTLAPLQIQKVQLEQALAGQDYNAICSQLESLSQAKSGIEQLNTAITSIQDGINQKESLVSQRDQLLQLQASYYTLLSSQAEYDSGLAQLNQGKAELETSIQELSDAKDTFNKEKDKNWKKIEDGQKEIDDLEGEWIVLDRDSHYSYRDYEACADRMDRIATVFPVFFFLVAALVCMTTMTRMVDEQRTEIGTLKALGYSKIQIASKYLIYASIAGLFGSILGCILGMIIFPYVIFTAWNILYNLDSIIFKFQPGLIALSSLSMIGVTLLATVLSIYTELMDVPSQLMRPKAGKAGKKILLEKIKPIWSRLTFLHKVTARNIFRYKKRFLMTVIGIAGCSALIVSGLGIMDSIANIVPRQFDAIYHYDASISADNDKDLTDQIKKIKGINEVYKEVTIAATGNIKDKEQNITVHIIDDLDSFKDFRTLYSIDDGKELSLNNQSVLISQKMASDMNKSVGDSITFKDADDKEITAKIGGIFENYVEHHIYVTEKVYESWHSTAEKSTNYLICDKSTDAEFESEIGNKLMKIDGINGVSFYSTLKDNFNDTIQSISFVAVVLVISAALLAFVVLYNLNNINISERIREIATLKVLGFTTKETNAYINRESLILTFFGAILGLFIGIFLHSMIMALAEMDDIMFGRTIAPISFVYSVCLTMVFSCIINLFMARKIKKIQMVESLKAVE